MLWGEYGDPIAVVPKKGNVSQTWHGILAIGEVLREGVDRGPQGDNCRWKFAANSMLIVKSTYEVACYYENLGYHGVWAAIWKLKGPQCLNLFLWKLRQDRAHTRSLYWKRGLVVDPSCYQCGAAMENGLHAIRDCAVVRDMWCKLLG